MDRLNGSGGEGVLSPAASGGNRMRTCGDSAPLSRISSGFVPKPVPGAERGCELVSRPGEAHSGPPPVFFSPRSIAVWSTTPHSRAEPEAVGLSSLRLRRIGEALRREVDAQRLPGAGVGIMRAGQLRHFEAV